MSVSVRLCGRLEVEWDGQRREDALVGRQSRVLFAYLTLHRDRPVRRDELVDALWAGEARSNGDALIRPLLSRVRRALGPAQLEGRAELALSFPADTWVDWEAAQGGLRRARENRSTDEHAAAWQAGRAALEIVERGFLPGLEADWIERFRGEHEELRCQLLEAVALAGTHLGDAELVVAEQAARRAVELSPFRESARVALIEVLRRRGNLAEALVAYEHIRTLLRDELGSLPGPDLRALHTTLLDAEAEPAMRIAPQGHTTLPDRLAQAAAASWVGREEMLARLHEAAGVAAGGASALVFVTGDGGIGKTRLVAELASTLTDFDVLYGRCDEEQQFPYGAWVEALRPRLARLADGELAALLGAGAADLARLLPEIRERLPKVASASRHGDPETERRQLFVAITQTLSRLAARRPLLVVIDDLHWADRSSLLLGRHVAGEPSLGAVLMVGTFRDTELHPNHPLIELIADLERHREPPRIALAGMDDGEVGALIGSVHDARVDTETVRAIRNETDGNPFFVKQLVRHLEDVGGNAGVEAFDGLAVPQSVRDVIARRVSRLPADAGPVLRTAALLGREFEFDLLAAVVDLDEDQLLDLLDAAVRGGLLVEVPPAPGRYSFVHALLRTTLEAELSRTRRARLHGRIGAAIEHRHAGRLEPWLNDLARHFGAAGLAESARAVDYAVRAAEQATRRLAYDESVRLLRQALSVCGAEQTEPAELAGLEYALAKAQASAGEGDASRASFARSADAARAAEDPGAFVRAALRGP